MIPSKLRHILFFLVLFLTTGSIVSCSSSLPELTISLDSLSKGDTIAYLTYIGSEEQITDTLLHFSKSITLVPDTAHFKRVTFVHARGEVVYSYTWDGKDWVMQEDISMKPQELTHVHPFSGKDVQGRERSLSELYTHHPVELVFASPETMKTITREKQRQVRRQANLDSITFVFLYPVSSDNTVRRLMKQDSLQGIAFSDSLGLVTELRQSYGISQNAQVIHLRIDTLGQIKH